MFYKLEWFKQNNRETMYSGQLQNGKPIIKFNFIMQINNDNNLLFFSYEKFSVKYCKRLQN